MRESTTIKKRSDKSMHGVIMADSDAKKIITLGTRQTPLPPQPAQEKARIQTLNIILRSLMLFLVLCTAFSFTGRAFWWGDLLAHLRLHYFFVFALMGAYFLLIRDIRHFLFATLASTINLVAIFMVTASNTYLEDRVPFTGLPNSAFVVATYNVDTQTSRPQVVVDWLSKDKPDLIVLIGVNRQWMPVFDRLVKIFPYQSIMNSSADYGMAILSRLPLDNIKNDTAGPLNLPLLSAEVETPLGRMCVTAIHPNPPLGADDTLTRNLYIDQASTIIRTRAIPCLLMGNINATPWSTGFDPLRTLPNLQPQLWQPPATWPVMLGAFGIPVDHILLTIPFEYHSYLKIKNLWLGPSLSTSSHRPVLAKITISPH